MRQKHVRRFLIRGAHPDDVVGGIEVAATKIDLVIVGHDHDDGGPREFLLPADGVDELQYLLQLRRRNRPGFICCGLCTSIDIIRTKATSNFFMQALIQLYFAIILRRPDRLNADLVGHPKGFVSGGRKRMRLNHFAT